MILTKEQVDTIVELLEDIPYNHFTTKHRLLHNASEAGVSLAMSHETLRSSLDIAMGALAQTVHVSEIPTIRCCDLVREMGKRASEHLAQLESVLGKGETK